jgi:hypothetical protein
MIALTPLEAAIATGLPCFPCTADKAPAIPGPGGFKHATADPAALRALCRQYPGELFGVPTGEVSGLAVLDIDKHADAIFWLQAHRAQLPPTRIHRTRSGGLHFIFQHAPGVRNSQGRLAKGIDTRGTGGYIIWWPLAGYPVVCEAPPAAWPQWLLEALFPLAPPLRGRSAFRAFQPLDQHRFEGLLRKVKFAQERQRNTSLFVAACRLGEAITKGEIGAAAARAALLYAALHAGLPEGEARRTIESGFRTTAT